MSSCKAGHTLVITIDWFPLTLLLLLMLSGSPYNDAIFGRSHEVILLWSINVPCCHCYVMVYKENSWRAVQNTISQPRFTYSQVPRFQAIYESCFKRRQISRQKVCVWFLTGMTRQSIIYFNLIFTSNVQMYSNIEGSNNPSKHCQVPLLVSWEIVPQKTGDPQVMVKVY